MSPINSLNEHDLQYLTDLVDLAGEALQRVFSRRSAVKKNTKPDGSFLTEADLVSNKILLQGLQSRWPQIPVLSEENLNTFTINQTPPLYWAVDPMDGTKEFLEGRGEFTTNIALVVNGKPQVGVVGVPISGVIYVGAYGGNDFDFISKKREAQSWKTIKVSGVSHRLLDDRPLRIVTSRSHPSPELTKWLKQFKTVHKRTVGSSLKFCMVAEGVADVYARFGRTCIWDTAAGHAIVEAAGGSVLQQNGSPITYKKPANVFNPFFAAWGCELQSQWITLPFSLNLPNPL